MVIKYIITMMVLAYDSRNRELVPWSMVLKTKIVIILSDSQNTHFMPATSLKCTIYRARNPVDDLLVVPYKTSLWSADVWW